MYVQYFAILTLLREGLCGELLLNYCVTGHDQTPPPGSQFAVVNNSRYYQNMCAADITSSGTSKIDNAKTGFLSTSKLSHLQNKWIRDNVTVELINEKIDLDDGMKIKKAEVNRVVSNHFRTQFDLLLLHVTNSHSIYS